MADQEHLRLVLNDVASWNAFVAGERGRKQEVRANLRGADLQKVNLKSALLTFCDLGGADLRDCQLEKADLRGAYMNRVKLDGANLQDANLSRADLGKASLQQSNLVSVMLRGTDLTGANLKRANLTGANLQDAHLNRAQLVDADFSETNLFGVSLSDSNLRGVDLKSSHFSGTILGNLDLTTAKNLSDVHHHGPSELGLRTLLKSKARIPEAFLRGCGLADWEILAASFYDPDLTEVERTDIAYEILRIQGESPIQINSLFISYSHADAAFVEYLEQQLQVRRIRFWRDVHDMKSGRIEKQIDRAMQLNPTVLLVLSKNSVESDWVEWEASKARELERKYRKEGKPQDVLCPVALDAAWKTCDWPGPLRRQIEKYFILDFSDWEERDIFEQQFGRLVEGLGLFYPGQKPEGNRPDRHLGP